MSIDDKTNDCPLPMIEEDTINELCEEKLRGDFYLNDQQSYLRFSREQPEVINLISRFFDQTKKRELSNLTNNDLYSILAGMEILYELLRA